MFFISIKDAIPVSKYKIEIIEINKGLFTPLKKL